MSTTAPIVIFGGTFDPPTRAHAELPPQAAALIGASKLLYVPAAISPHKIDEPPTDPAHRLAMLRLVVDGIEGAELCDIELHRDGPSYSIDTIRQLREDIDDDVPLRLLIGDDQAVTFHSWRDWADLIELAVPLVLPRHWSDASEFADALRTKGQWPEVDVERWLQWRLDLPCMDTCSTEARRMIFEHRDARDVLVPDVDDYIKTNELYR
ncbi:MAG: nicotinate (nicotinamide) nucleotide adenylyltransferase [Phycisphaerales bacterium]|nr:nicotinate (nicotinamide) nucleotide adenylyltransferase [Phycisphaerales bacterium]